MPRTISQLSYRFIGEDQTRKLSENWKIRALYKIALKQTIASQKLSKEALEMLKEVEVYNTLHCAAIELPSVQTCQIKKFYEPVMDMKG